MKKMIASIKAFFTKVSAGLIKVFGKVAALYNKTVKVFYVKRVRPILKKIGYALTHNFIDKLFGLTLILFSFIKIKMTRKRREALRGYIFILPWLIGFAIFTLYPMFYSLYLSFQEAYYNAQQGVISIPAGITNYLNIFRSQTLLPMYATYVGKMLLSVPLVVVFSILIAVLINNPIKLKGFWRTIFFLPVVIATGPVINELTNQEATSLPSLQDSEVLLSLTRNLGSWIANPIESLLSSMLLVLWYAGIPILIFLAGLQKIDSSIYEAASIDGASPWDRFWKITLPSIKPLITVAVIYVVVSMSLFVEPNGILDLARQHMINGGPDSSFRFGYGYAAAMAWIYFILMVLIMLIFVGLLSIRKEEK